MFNSATQIMVLMTIADLGLIGLAIVLIRYDIRRRERNEAIARIQDAGRKAKRGCFNA